MTDRIPEQVKDAVLALPNLVKLLARLMADPAVPLRRKIVAGAAGAYVFAPIDLIPDFIPVLGQVDDLIVVALGLKHLIEGASEDVVRQHWDGPEDVLELVTNVIDWGAGLAPRALHGVFNRLSPEDGASGPNG
ncbi:MAG: YkvA family protein [Acidimicrobiia bacterium]|nr:YkvA family protein [Acidimicrobiia bacterium]